jgi:hypothetical protein
MIERGEACSAAGGERPKKWLTAVSVSAASVLAEPFKKARGAAGG